MGKLDNKKILITGAGGEGSIGRATANAMAAEGAVVVINELAARSQEANDALREVKAHGRAAYLVLGDVADATECARIVEQASNLMSGLDVLINNAGGARDKAFLDIDEAHFDQQVDVHLKGPFFLAQAAARIMLAKGEGKIINIASELAYVGEPLLIPYTSAKGGLRTMTKAMALALAPHITVNSVSPGPTATKKFRGGREYNDENRLKIPLQRFVEPYDVARSIIFLASSDGNVFTGQTLDPNCGVIMD